MMMQESPAHPTWQPTVSDAAVYRERFTELMRAAREAALLSGSPVDGAAVEAAAAEADKLARSTPFALAATAMIRGDKMPAEKLCALERDTHGEEAADQLMKMIERAVIQKQCLIDEAVRRLPKRPRNRWR